MTENPQYGVFSIAVTFQVEAQAGSQTFLCVCVCVCGGGGGGGGGVNYIPMIMMQCSSNAIRYILPLYDTSFHQRYSVTPNGYCL